MKKIISLFTAMVMMVALVVPASAANREMNEDNYTCRVEVPMIGSNVRVGTTIGHPTAEYNSFFSWGRAITEVYAYGEPTYLLARATVSADNCVDKTETKSSTSQRSVTTDKVYQYETAGRMLSTYHVVEGYWTTETELRTEYYAGDYEF